METLKEYIKEADVWPDAAIALEESLNQVPGAKVSVTLSPVLAGGMQPDLLAHFSHEEHQVTLVGEVKKIGEPQHARAAFYQLNQYRNSLPGAIKIFLAPYISPATAKLCRDEDVGYQDLAGNCHIAFDGVYIHVEGKSNPAARSRRLLSLYQPKAERVLRVLLSHPPMPWRIQALADEAEVSIGQVFKVKELLREKTWLSEANWGAHRGVQIAKPVEVLADWAEHYRFGKHQMVLFHTLVGLDHFELDFSGVCRSLNIPCAFTSLAAAARYAPHATYQRTLAYVKGDLANLQRAFDLIPVETGANVVLLIPYDDGVFYADQQKEGVSLVSPIQTYLDLQSAGGRGREAAEVLFQKEIAPKW